MKLEQTNYPMNHTATVLMVCEPDDEAAKAAAAAAAKAEAEKAQADKAAQEAAAKAAAEKAAQEAAAAEAAAREAQEKKDRGEKLSDNEAKLLKEVMGFKERAKKAEDALKAFEGIDPVAVKKMLEEKQQREQEELARKGEWDKIKAQMAEQQKAVVAQKDNEIKARDDQLAQANKQIADLTVGHAFNSSKFITDELALTPNKTRALYGSHFEFKDGKVVGYDAPAGTKDRAPLVDKDGNPLSFEAALSKLIEADPEKDSLKRSKVAAGAGSGTQNSGAPAPAADARANVGKGLARIQAGLEKRAAEKSKK